MPYNSTFKHIAVLLITASLFTIPSSANEQRRYFYQIITDRFATDKTITCDQNASSLEKQGRFGGNLNGITNKLDYIKALGITDIIISPLYTASNKATNTYHGYSPVNFTEVEPHFGGAKALLSLMQEAKKRQLGIGFDFVFNHTADLFSYKECAPCLFSNTPRTLINNSQERRFPDWMNDPQYFHAYGDVDFTNSNTFIIGDLYGLDDFKHELPFVQDALIKLHQKWMTDFQPSGFRIDSAKYIDKSFTHKMLLANSSSQYIIGEYTYYSLKEFASIPNQKNLLILNLLFTKSVFSLLQGKTSPKEFASSIRDIFSSRSNWLNLVSSHDFGRLARSLYWLTTDQIINFIESSYLLSFLLSSNNMIYYGDEQGFLGMDGDGQFDNARENMFPRCGSPYKSRSLLGKSYFEDHFDQNSKIYNKLKKIIAFTKDIPPANAKFLRATPSGLLEVPLNDNQSIFYFNFTKTSKKLQQRTIDPGQWIQIKK